MGDLRVGRCGCPRTYQIDAHVCMVTGESAPWSAKREGIVEIDRKVVVVTGGASGIGLAIAQEFAAAGARLGLLDVEAEALEIAASELASAGVEVQSFQVDVRRPDRLGAIADEIEDVFGGTDVLCNNAGVLAAPGNVWSVPREDIEWVFAVNFWGALHAIQAFVPRMVERGTPSYVVNISSVSAIAPMASAASYMMSKSALLTLSETLREDLRAVGAPTNVAVVLPEHFRTRLGTAHRNRATPEDSRSWEPIWNETDDPMLTYGDDPRILGRRVVGAVRDELFWVLPPASDAMSQSAIERLHEIERSFL